MRAPSSWLGPDIVGLPPRAIWQLGVGRTFQIAETFASLTVVENVQMALLSHATACFRSGRARRTTGAPMRWRCSTRWACGAGAAPLQRAGLWRREAGGAGHRAGPRAPPAADGRAHGRHGAAERLALMALTQQLARERGMGVLFTEHSMDVVFATPTA
jgi:branched-chain amino acid transport system ATP-binding protein